MNLEKSDISLPKTDANDRRVGHFIHRACDQPQAVIIGFPSDEGVKRNGGRPGAAQAPHAIRRQLYKLTPDARNFEGFTTLLKQTNDAGNVPVTGDLEADQERLGTVIAKYLEQGVCPIILGGGHGTAFGHFLGYAQANLSTSIFNLDAHTDVRPLKNGQAHSGSPFRQTIEHESNCCKKYTAMGLQPHSVAQAHLQFVKKHGGNAVLHDLTNINTITNQLVKSKTNRMVTFDMDAVDQAYAPGVSAPCTHGLSQELWLKAAYQAGSSKNVTSFDLVEVNPKYDRDHQTAKLAALTIWHFMQGLSQQ